MGNELGIVFTGGEGPPPGRCRAVLEEARAGNRKALIAAADSGLIAAEAAGVRPDWIIGDMDSVAGGRLAAYGPERVLRYPADKDYTDTELAVSLLREKGSARIWIIGGGGGRIDHLFAIRSLFERDRPPERWITSREDIRCLESPGALECTPGGNVPRGRGLSERPGDAAPANGEKPYPISVFPLGTGPWKAASRGLKWPLTGLVWERGFFGLSNEAPEGAFTIYAETGRFMVILPA
ncbi:MAG: thiamine pyrophosphokinase [Treponema sp.]|jgi:thiamine pyrophosphokinase|nr:thiamine pyrophosphokinase [Treponema sp.]